MSGPCRPTTCLTALLAARAARAAARSRPLLVEHAVRRARDLPAGPPMVPAAGPVTTDGRRRRRPRVGRHRRRRGAAATTPDLVARVPDAGAPGRPGSRSTAPWPRRCSTRSSAGAPPVDDARARRPRVARSRRRPAGRRHHRRVRVVNERYRAEHPALLARSLAHDLLWTRSRRRSVRGGACSTRCARSCTCSWSHARPRWRRSAPSWRGAQNSLAVTLLNSRHPGSADISRRARPTARARSPAARPAMQTPDFWSIPFVGGTAASG